MVIFKANFTRNRLCAEQTSIFNVFLTEVIICSFNNNTLQKWTNGKACLHVSVTKFQDKFASLRQVNSPYSWNKFQICCTDMYLIIFLPKFAVFFVFLWISWIYLNFAAPQPCKISEALAEEGLVAKGEKTWLQMRPIQLQCQALL